MATTDKSFASRNNATRNTKRPYGKTDSEILKVSDEHRPFRRINIYLMALCVTMIVVGFLLMLGPGSSVEEGFNPDIFSTRRIALGPAVTFLGFLFMAFAIIWSPVRKGSELTKEETPKQP